MSEVPHAMVSRIQVKNFRSLSDVDVKLENLTVLAGVNGSGKSNLVDALRFVRDALTKGLNTAVLDRKGFQSLRHRLNEERTLSIQIHLEGPTWHGEYGFTLKGQKNGQYQVKAERAALTQGTQVTIAEIQEGEWVQWPASLPASPEQFFPSESLLSPQLNIQHLVKPFHLMFNILQTMGFYTIYPDKLREPQSPASAYPLDEREGKNLASVLQELREHPVGDEIQTALSKIVNGVNEYLVTEVGGFLVTHLRHTDTRTPEHPTVFPLAQESDGTLRALGLLTALYQTPRRSLVAIEEPELTIYDGIDKVKKLCYFTPIKYLVDQRSRFTLLHLSSL